MYEDVLIATTGAASRRRPPSRGCRLWFAWQFVLAQSSCTDSNVFGATTARIAMNSPIPSEEPIAM